MTKAVALLVTVLAIPGVITGILYRILYYQIYKSEIKKIAWDEYCKRPIVYESYNKLCVKILNEQTKKQIMYIMVASNAFFMHYYLIFCFKYADYTPVKLKTK